MLSCFEYLNNSQKIHIVSFVLCFGCNYFTCEVSYRVPMTQTVASQLIWEFTNSVALSIGLNLNKLYQVKVLKDWRLTKYLFRLCKRFFTIRVLITYSSVQIRCIWWFFDHFISITSTTNLSILSHVLWQVFGWSVCGGCFEYQGEYSSNLIKTLDK